MKYSKGTAIDPSNALERRTSSKNELRSQRQQINSQSHFRQTTKRVETRKDTRSLLSTIWIFLLRQTAKSWHLIHRVCLHHLCHAFVTPFKQHLISQIDIFWEGSSCRQHGSTISCSGGKAPLCGFRRFITIREVKWKNETKIEEVMPHGRHSNSRFFIRLSSPVPSMYPRWVMVMTRDLLEPRWQINQAWAVRWRNNFWVYVWVSMLYQANPEPWTLRRLFLWFFLRWRFGFEYISGIIRTSTHF